MLIVDGQKLALVDLDSKNGTFVNGRQVSRAEVVAGDVLSLGPYCLAVEELDSADVALAVRVREDSSIAAWSEAGTTSPARSVQSREKESVIDLVVEFSESLALENEIAPALAHLQAALEAEAVLALDLDSPVPSVLAAAGYPTALAVRIMVLAWEAAGRRQAPPLRWSWSGSSGRTDLQSTAVISRHSGVARGLLVIARKEPDPDLLRCLLSVLELRWPTEISQSSAEQISQSEVELPKGCIKCPSPAMAEIYQQVAALAISDLPVLIVGETGTGKEYLAKSLHLSSRRSDRAFVPINCAAIPEDLLESELFGIGDGVATGVSRRQGRFLEAEGGTLFLDEIGEMPAALQAKLLRALQEGIIYPLGSPARSFDARIVAATNVNIYQRMKSGRFRQDLFYRLAGSVVTAPPLRQRHQDIPVLVESFLRRFSTLSERRIRGLSVKAMQVLLTYAWPGNIRELENEIRRLVYLCPNGKTIESGMFETRILRAAQSADLNPRAWPEDGRSGHSAGSWGSESLMSAELPTLKLEVLEQIAIDQAMEETQHKLGQAAEILGITRFALRRRFRRLGKASK